MISIFSKFNLRVVPDSDPGKWQPRARRDWKIIFFTAIVVGLGFLFFHIFLYYYTLTNNVFFENLSGPGASSNNIDQQGLQNVIRNFSERKDRTNALLNSPLRTKDPSSSSATAPASSVPLNATSSPLLSQ